MNKKPLCGVCQSEKEHAVFRAREMMFGWRHQFDYFECSECGTVQIARIPENLSDYYPSDYYAFESSEIEKLFFLKRWLRRQRQSFYLGARNPLGALLHRARRQEIPLMNVMMRAANLTFHSQIADLGSGSGRLLNEFQRDGFRNLTGIDPFIERDVLRPNGVRLLKREIAEVDQRFDFIMLHHAFEHMPDPQHTLLHIAQRLNKGGHCLIRIPVATYAWKHYRCDWFQLDAPRHLFLHTVKGMDILSKNAGLKLKRLVFDSGAEQFIYSEGYQRDISLKEIDIHSTCSVEEIAEFHERAQKLNAEQQGDQAAFLFVKN